MPEKILLIAPRWLPESVARQHLESWRAKQPHAQFILLTHDENLPIWTLPPLEPRALLHFARRLRRQRFRRAVVLTDAARGDVGYGEAKLWAFISNARRREFNGKPLTLGREAKAKRPVAAIFGAHLLATLCEILKVARRDETVVSPELLSSARTFAYLQHAIHQHSAVPGRVLLIGTKWNENTSRRCGWEVADRVDNSKVNLVLADDEKAIVLKSALLCLSEIENAPSISIRKIIETRPAFFDETAHDIWLVQE